MNEWGLKTVHASLDILWSLIRTVPLGHVSHASGVSNQLYHQLKVHPSWNPSSNPSFLRSFIPSFLRSFLPSFLLAFLPLFLPSIIGSIRYFIHPSIHPSNLPSSLLPTCLLYLYLFTCLFSSFIRLSEGQYFLPHCCLSLHLGSMVTSAPWGMYKHS